MDRNDTAISLYDPGVRLYQYRDFWNGKTLARVNRHVKQGPGVDSRQCNAIQGNIGIIRYDIDNNGLDENTVKVMMILSSVMLDIIISVTQMQVAEDGY